MKIPKSIKTLFDKATNLTVNTANDSMKIAYAIIYASIIIALALLISSGLRKDSDDVDLDP